MPDRNQDELVRVEHGCLTITTDEQTFNRLQSAITQLVGVDDDSLAASKVIGIWIRNADAVTTAVDRGARDRIALVGCAIIAFALLFVFAMGIAAMFFWR